MDLVSWTPVVTRIASRVRGRSFPSFYVKAELMCLICGEVTTAKSPSYELKIEERTVADHFIISPIVAIRGERPCRVCGTVSVIPPRQVKQLEAQMKQTIDLEWIGRHIAATPQVSAKWAHEREVKERFEQIIEDQPPE